ncbi:MAG: enoyl-CoA hydratase/isomerase family protein [Hyphomicrobiales bacterium]|nr:enoyl-CoA hydratase/isomerase family protein [Hyphomicrobiales bacterium]
MGRTARTHAGGTRMRSKGGKEVISLETRDGYAVATLSRPPVNAINEEWLDRLSEIVDEVDADAKVHVLVIRSDQASFCGGADLKLMRERFATEEGRADMIAFVRRIQEVYRRLEAMPAVSIAEVCGPALGGGLELALSCDFRIIADEAKVGLPEVRLGLLPGAGGTQRLTRVCGVATAKRLILGGEIVDGKEAERIGLAHWAVPAAEIAAFTDKQARSLAGLSGPALGYCKHCIEAAVHMSPDGFERELTGTNALFADPETQKRVRAFLEGKSGRRASA